MVVSLFLTARKDSTGKLVHLSLLTENVDGLELDEADQGQNVFCSWQKEPEVQMLPPPKSEGAEMASVESSWPGPGKIQKISGADGHVQRGELSWKPSHSVTFYRWERQM